MAYLKGLKELEYTLGLDLAVSGEELHLDALPQHLEQKRLDQLLLVDVQRGLDVAQGEVLHIDEEEALIVEEEALLAPARPGVGVAEASAGVVGVARARLYPKLIMKCFHLCF